MRLHLTEKKYSSVMLTKLLSQNVTNGTGFTFISLFHWISRKWNQ